MAQANREIGPVEPRQRTTVAVWGMVVLTVVLAPTPWWPGRGNVLVSAWQLMFPVLMAGWIVVCLVCAAILRRWLLAVGAILAALATGVTLGIGPVESTEAGECSSPSVVRVYSLNTKGAAVDTDTVVSQIQRARADTVMLQEVDELFVADVQRRLGAQVWRHKHVEQPTGITSGTALLSTRSFEVDPFSSEVSKTFGSVLARFALDGQPVHVGSVHVPPPLISKEAWLQGFSDVQTWQGTLGVNESVFLIGDFNATAAHPEFRALFSEFSYRPGWLSRPTWRLDQGPHISYGALDHILARNVMVFDREFHHVPGADHLALQAAYCVKS